MISYQKSPFSQPISQSRAYDSYSNYFNFAKYANHDTDDDDDDDGGDVDDEVDDDYHSIVIRTCWCSLQQQNPH